MSVSDVAAHTGLARPTSRRLLMTLEELGYVRSIAGAYSLTAKVLEIGTASIAAQGIWDVASPHMRSLVSHTSESSSMSQLDGSDIVYIARVAVPKIISLSVRIGSRFPAVAASMGHVLLADLEPDQLAKALSEPSNSGVIPRVQPSESQFEQTLIQVREQGWALADEILSLGIRSIAAPVFDGTKRVAAALNVTVHAAEMSVKQLIEGHLPRLLETAAGISDDWQHLDRLPVRSAT
jgi:IclR family pca regulon transcriptional regulator